MGVWAVGQVTLNPSGEQPSSVNPRLSFSLFATQMDIEFDGWDFADIYADILQTQAAVPQRYRGRVPAHTGRTAIGSGARLANNGETALDALEGIVLDSRGSMEWHR